MVVTDDKTEALYELKKFYVNKYLAELQISIILTLMLYKYIIADLITNLRAINKYS